MIDKLFEIITTAVRGCLVYVSTVVAAFFYPVHNFLYVLIAAFIVDCVLGFCADKERKTEFSFKKFITGVKNMAWIMLSILFAYFVGMKMNLNDTQVIDFVSYLMWFVIYGYAVNITRNLKIVAPNVEAFRIFYYVLTVQFVKDIKILSNYKNHKDDENK